MEKRTLNNITLGVFVILGVLVLAVSLYMIGQNQNFFGSNFPLKARFRNVNGLMPGNNVRFSGIQCGTVKDITIINDTTIEVRMFISQKTSGYIRANARASIGTEGLMGNKVVDIIPGTSDAPPIAEGGMLPAASAKGMDDILNTLSSTSDNALGISAGLKETTGKINSSPLLIALLADTTIAQNLRQSLENFRQASADIRNASATVNQLAGNMKGSKSAAGVLLSDSVAARQMSQSITHIHKTVEQADRLLADVDSLTRDLHDDMNRDNGIAGVLLKDSSIVLSVRQSLDNINRGTGAFSEDMEALKHNFLLKHYFKKQRKHTK